jgi:hypothetical protein
MHRFNCVSGEGTSQNAYVARGNDVHLALMFLCAAVALNELEPNYFYFRSGNSVFLITPASGSTTTNAMAPDVALKAMSLHQYKYFSVSSAVFCVKRVK